MRALPKAFTATKEPWANKEFHSRCGQNHNAHETHQEFFWDMCPWSATPIPMVPDNL